MTVNRIKALRRVPFSEPEPMVTPAQIGTLQALVRKKGWDWRQFTVFVNDHLLTVPSCMTQREAEAVIDYVEAAAVLERETRW